METEIKVTDRRYRLGYHLMPKGGWMNDPNGFSWFKGYYHIFYQYYPYASEWGPMHWGHARSRDMLHWETLPVALVPGDQEDGCFSGSAVVFEDKLWLIYTGHHYTDAEDPEAFYEDQNIAWSEDGIHFTKYEGNPVLRTPAGNTKHFRDPKVWQEGDTFYMVLGSQAEDGLGRALVYESKDLKRWQGPSVLTKSADCRKEGYMWECPDFFTLDGQDILLMSPQGLEAQGDKYRNRDQTGYMIGKTQSDKTMKRGGFVEIDRGHDFYATQTMMTPDHRRVMIAWMNAWDSPMYEKADGWAGALTIPRELIVQNGRLIQRPIREIDSLRVKKICENEADVGYRIKLPRTAEILLDFDKAALEKGRLLKIGNEKQQMEMFVDKAHNRLVLQRQTADGERAAALPQLEHLKLHLFLDKSSAEIFVNDGDLTFTERLYWQGDIELELMAGAAKVTVYALEPETNRY